MRFNLLLTRDAKPPAVMSDSDNREDEERSFDGDEAIGEPGRFIEALAELRSMGMDGHFSKEVCLLKGGTDRGSFSILQMEKQGTMKIS